MATNGIVYFDGSTVQSAAAGTSGQYLQSQGSGTPPAMAALSGAMAITGITNGGAASAGIVGEIITAAVAQGSAVSLTNNTNTDITSISLTAGDWDLFGVICFRGNVTGTLSFGFFGTAAGNNTTGQDLARNCKGLTICSTTFDLNLDMPTFPVNVSGTTTYYLKALSMFSVGTQTAYGSISARRVR